MIDCMCLVCVIYVLNIFGKVYLIVEFVSFIYDCGVLICVDVVVYVLYRLIDVQVWDVDYYVFSFYKVYGLYGVLMYGKYDFLVDLDGFYYYFYGCDKIIVKLELGNLSYEVVYVIDGILVYLIGLVYYYGVMGDNCVLLVVVFNLIIV